MLSIFEENQAEIVPLLLVVYLVEGKRRSTPTCIVGAILIQKMSTTHSFYFFQQMLLFH